MTSVFNSIASSVRDLEAYNTSMADKAYKQRRGYTFITNDGSLVISTLEQNCCFMNLYELSNDYLQYTTIHLLTKTKTFYALLV